MGSVAGVGPLPLLALPLRPVLLPPPPLSPRSRRGGGVNALPPPPASRSGAGGGRSGCARSASGRARSPLPGPLGLGLGVRAAPCFDRSRSGFRGFSSPTPSGVTEEDCDSISGSVDLDRDDPFRSVLRLIREFHGMEEPASVVSNRCKTSLAPIYGLQSESSPARHLPLSPLLDSRLEDTNLALAKFVEDQTVHGFLPVPGRQHRKYYRTSSSSFPGLYTVPPGLASITLDKVSESKKRSVSLSHSQASSLETMLSGVCEVTYWLDWWLSTCGGFREHIPDEVRGNFERLMLSGSRALEFLGDQGVTALGKLVLSHRDSLLVDARSTVPSEEVARLRYADLTSSLGIFPSPLLDSALNKMRAASNYALVQRTLHPPKIPRKCSAGPSKAGSSSSASADRSGVSPIVSRSQQQASTTPSSSSSRRGKIVWGPRVRHHFQGPLVAPAALELNEKGPGKSPDQVREVDHRSPASHHLFHTEKAIVEGGARIEDEFQGVLGQHLLNLLVQRQGPRRSRPVRRKRYQVARKGRRVQEEDAVTVPQDGQHPGTRSN